MKLLSLNSFLFFFILGNLTFAVLKLPLLFPQQKTTYQKITCPPTPKNVLEANQLKSISISAFSTQLSGLVTPDRDQGYIFKANAGQKFKYNKLDDVCIWVYTPNNQLMTSSTFPIDGKYIMQVASLQQSVNFDIYVSLEVNPNIKQEINENLAKLTPFEEPSPVSPKLEPDPSEKIVFEELLNSHFDNLSNQYYNIAWSELSPALQEILKDPQHYKNIWQHFDTLKLLQLEILSKTTDRISLTIEIEYSLDYQTNHAMGQVKLLFDPIYSKWLIDDIEIYSEKPEQEKTY